MPGLHVLDKELLRVEASDDLDRLQILISVADLGISGYQAADWLRANQLVDMGLSDHQRILATMSMADDDQTGQRLLSALEALVTAAPGLPEPSRIDLPDPSGLRAGQR